MKINFKAAIGAFLASSKSRDFKDVVFHNTLQLPKPPTHHRYTYNLLGMMYEAEQDSEHELSGMLNEVLIKYIQINNKNK